MTSDYYVYLIRRADGTPCCVGKGRGKRIDHFRYKTHNKLLERIARCETVTAEKLAENLTNEQAKATEIETIRLFGRRNLGTGPLVNFTDGGDGGLAIVRSRETVAKLVAAMKGRKLSPEWIANSAAAHRGQKRTAGTCARISAALVGRSLPPETRARIAAAKLGKPAHPNVIAANRARRGVPKSPEHAEKLRDVLKRTQAVRSAKAAITLSRPKTAAEIAANPAMQKGVPKSAAHREAMRAAQLGKKRSPGQIRRSAEGHRGLKRSEETKRRMSVAQRQAWIRRRAALPKAA